MRKFARKNPVSLPPGGVIQLMSGQDFFGDAWGREPGPEEIAQMHEAWRDPVVRKAVRKRTEATWGPRVRPFAHFLFGADGRRSRVLTAEDVREARRRYRAEREGSTIFAPPIDISNAFGIF